MQPKEKHLISYSRPDRRVLVEDVYHNLARQPSEDFRKQYGQLKSSVYQQLRAAGEWVSHRLRRKLCGELAIPQEQYAAFLQGDADAYDAVRPLLLQFLNCSEEELTPLWRHEKPGKSREKAARWLDTAALAQMCRQAGISASTWYRFQNGTTAPGEDTLQAFVSLLELKEEDRVQLKRLVRKDDIDSLERLRPEVQRQWQQWQRRMQERGEAKEDWSSLSVFWDYTAVSPNAMKVFGCGTEVVSGKSSQGTLLKLNIAFAHDPGEGRRFLALGDSDYYTMRDMLFLTCLYLKLYDVRQIDEILEFYAANPKDPTRPRLENPYRSRGQL